MQTDFVPEYLPAWMRQSRRSIDWGILLAAVLGLIAGWAFFFRDGVPAYSGLVHSGFMISDLSEALGEGRVVARWSPHALGGYGAPIPNYIPQGAAFLAALTDRLLTGNATSALRLVMAIAMLAAGIGQYLFCRRWIGPSSAILAAGLYLFSPILGLVAPFVAGDMPGVVGMAALPFALWTASRSTKNSSKWDVPFTGIAFASLLYLNPPVAGVGASIALALTLPDGFRAVRKLIVSLLAAAGLFAPYWLPAAVEAEAVRWRQIIAESRIAIRLDSLIQPLRQIDPIVLNPVPQYTLGIVLPLFAAGGFAWTLLHRRERRFGVAMFTAVIALAIAASAFNRHWLTYPMTLCCAALGGLALEWRTKLPARIRRATLAGALVLLIVGSSGVWLSPLGPAVSDFSPLAQVEFEQNGFGVGALPSGNLLPATLPSGIGTERSLVESYRDPPLERIRPGTPARVTPIATGTHGSSWQVSVTSPTRITLSLAYFPGWEADLDGIPLPLDRDPANGLVRISLPPTTNGTLRITMGTPPEHTVAWIIAGTVLLLMGLWGRLTPQIEPANVVFLNVPEVRLTAVALTFAGLVVLAAAVPGGSIDLRAEPFSSLRGAQALTVDGDPIRLLAYRLGAPRARAGDDLAFTLYWTAITVPRTNYGVRLVLIDINNLRRFNVTGLTPPGNLPTRRWLAGFTIIDHYELSLPATLPIGTYQFVVEAFPCSGECDLTSPLRFRDTQGVERSSILLPSVLTIER